MEKIHKPSQTVTCTCTHNYLISILNNIFEAHILMASTEFLSFSFKNSSNIAASSSRYCSASSSFFSSACKQDHIAAIQ